MRSSMRHFLQECNRPAKDPLLQTCILIAQFLIIHPFMDGNGRTARILIPLLLYKKGILSHPLLFLSRYLKDRRAAYFQGLFDITGKDKWEEWIDFLLKGVIKQAQKEKIQANRILKLYHSLQRKLSCSYARMPFLLFLFSQPVFSRAQFTKRYSARLLKELHSLKIVKPFKKSYYTFPGLLNIVKNKKTPKGKTLRG
jgi:Fic family protein